MSSASRTRAPASGPVVVAFGAAVLLARPALVRATSHPVGLMAAVFVALLAVGVAWPIVHGAERNAGRLVMVTAAGAIAFALGRLVGDWRGPSALIGRLVMLNGLAAVAEEAFFRRFLYGLLERRGAVVAVFGSAALFAAVHVTVYGAWVLPIDVAAGLVLSWQRWAAGSWGPPAVTHVIANVLALS